MGHSILISHPLMINLLAILLSCVTVQQSSLVLLVQPSPIKNSHAFFLGNLV